MDFYSLDLENVNPEEFEKKIRALENLDFDKFIKDYIKNLIPNDMFRFFLQRIISYYPSFQDDLKL